MVEKVITLENVSLLDFLGSENENIRQISAAFPQSKIVSRGNEIRIKGQAPEILKINDILNMLLEHFNRYGLVTPENVKEYIDLEGTPQKKSENINAVILYGNKGVIVRPKSPNQKKLVDASYKNDLVFAFRPCRYR